MTERPLTILVVDDDELDRLSLRRALDKSGLEARIHDAVCGAAALEAVEAESFDCILVDQRLPDGAGVELLQEIRQRASKTPALVLLSGAGDELLATAALKNGADDYLPKDAVTPDTLRRAVASATELVSLRAANLAHERQRLAERTMLKKAELMAELGSWEYDFATDRITWSDGMYALIGVSRDSFSPEPMIASKLLTDEYRDSYVHAVTQLRKHGTPFELEQAFTRPNGQVRWIHHTGQAIRDDDGCIVGAFGIVQDLTERRRTEEVLERAERIEAIGVLAGGIAHDFNNLLGIIVGNLGLLRRQVPDSPRALDKLDLIERAAKRGSRLIHKLLNFSHQEQQGGDPACVNELLASMAKTLEQAVPGRVRMSIYAAPEVWPTDVVADDFEDAVLNLVLNGCDAMPDGGSLIIETANKRTDMLPGHRARRTAPVDYVVVSISDTGHGMSREVRERVFEPFFTTKAGNNGTGLGLSMVYGFVRRSNGDIRIYSEPGSGTTIQIYLPRSQTDAAGDAGGAAADQARVTGNPVKGSGQVVLVVDDEPDLIGVLRELLEDLGYRTLSAGGGTEALEVLGRDRVDLVLSDIVMQGGMNGVELGREIRHRWPDLPVLLSSGYSARVARSFGDDPLLRDILPKPWSADELAEKVRQRLARRGADAGTHAA